MARLRAVPERVDLEGRGEMAARGFPVSDRERDDPRVIAQGGVAGAQGEGMPLSERQRQGIDWKDSDGDEPPGG